MFNEEEWMKVLKYSGYGAAGGAVLCALLFVYSLGAEIWNCMCDCFGDSSTAPVADEGSTYFFVFIICLGIGLMVGLFAAYCDRSERVSEEEQKRKEKESQEAKRQRIAWASEVQKKAHEVMKICNKNYNGLGPIIDAEYMADSQMITIADELANMSELNGKINSMAQDIKTKGGTEK